MKDLVPCAQVPIAGYKYAGRLCMFPVEFDVARGLGDSEFLQFTKHDNYPVQVPETPGIWYVGAIERWEKDGPWRIVLHRFASSQQPPAAFEYAGPFDNLEAAVVAYMLLWP